MENNLLQLAADNPWLKEVLKQAFEHTLKYSVHPNTLEEDVENFLVLNSPLPEITMPDDYHKDDYEGKQAYADGYLLYPKSYPNGANDDLKRGWHARQKEIRKQRLGNLVA